MAALVSLAAGCGVQPSGVMDAGPAPTGVAPGVTLYFLDDHDRLRPQLRQSGQLGTIAEALSLLLTGPGPTDLHTDLPTDAETRVPVQTTPELIRLWVPWTIADVPPLGIDQIVCTALGVHVQAGGSTSTRVQVRFTLPTPESDEQRTCPLISAR
ncbi:hypothetical protein [Nocardia terpenica]|uniref:hypothetical protein n=1 Tax=Nocardia terpenica TaxID=455432 RepID=UPI0018E08D56|nr:hypothetical protein [Nocardia terpenica]